jgi:hypothetical protein
LGKKLVQRRNEYANHLKDKKHSVLHLAREQLKVAAALLEDSSSSSSSSSSEGIIQKNVLLSANINKGPFSMDDFNE